MPKPIKVFTDSDELYKADQKVKGFLKSHSKELSDSERSELGKLLDKRARAASKALGIKIGSPKGKI